MKASMRNSTKTWKVKGGRVLKIMVGIGVLMLFTVAPPLFSSSSSSSLYSHGSVMSIAAMLKEITIINSRLFFDNNTIISFDQGRNKLLFLCVRALQGPVLSGLYIEFGHINSLK